MFLGDQVVRPPRSDESQVSFDLIHITESRSMPFTSERTSKYLGRPTRASIDILHCPSQEIDVPKTTDAPLAEPSLTSARLDRATRVPAVRKCLFSGPGDPRDSPIMRPLSTESSPPSVLPPIFLPSGKRSYASRYPGAEPPGLPPRSPPATVIDRFRPETASARSMPPCGNIARFSEGIAASPDAPPLADHLLQSCRHQVQKNEPSLSSTDFTAQAAELQALRQRPQEYLAYLAKIHTPKTTTPPMDYLTVAGFTQHMEQDEPSDVESERSGPQTVSTPIKIHNVALMTHGNDARAEFHLSAGVRHELAASLRPSPSQPHCKRREQLDPRRCDAHSSPCANRKRDYYESMIDSNTPAKAKPKDTEETGHFECAKYISEPTAGGSTSKANIRFACTSVAVDSCGATLPRKGRFSEPIVLVPPTPTDSPASEPSPDAIGVPANPARHGVSDSLPSQGTQPIAITCHGPPLSFATHWDYNAMNLWFSEFRQELWKSDRKTRLLGRLRTKFSSTNRRMRIDAYEWWDEHLTEISSWTSLTAAERLLLEEVGLDLKRQAQTWLV